jgi:hypothetical protein
MLKKLGFTSVALLGMLILFAPAPASAQVRFGVSVGGPAPVYGYAAPPVYPAYPVPYNSYYDAPYYPAPVYVGPSYGYGYGYGYRGYYGRGYDYRRDFRGNYGRGNYGRGHESFRGGHR